jgi:hypothetical protein
MSSDLSLADQEAKLVARLKELEERGKELKKEHTSISEQVRAVRKRKMEEEDEARKPPISAEDPALILLQDKKKKLEEQLRKKKLQAEIDGNIIATLLCCCKSVLCFVALEAELQQQAPAAATVPPNAAAPASAAAQSGQSATRHIKQVASTLRTSKNRSALLDALKETVMQEKSEQKHREREGGREREVGRESHSYSEACSRRDELVEKIHKRRSIYNPEPERESKIAKSKKSKKNDKKQAGQKKRKAASARGGSVRARCKQKDKAVKRAPTPDSGTESTQSESSDDSPSLRASRSHRERDDSDEGLRQSIATALKWPAVFFANRAPLLDTSVVGSHIVLAEKGENDQVSLQLEEVVHCFSAPKTQKLFNVEVSSVLVKYRNSRRKRDIRLEPSKYNSQLKSVGQWALCLKQN